MPQECKVQPILVDLIDIGEENVRKTRAEEGLDELRDSIEKLGLLQPIAVFEENGRYKLVLGQRRLLAVKELKWDKISANIIPKMDLITAKIISLSENIHRKKLPYKDIVDACSFLYDEYDDIGKVAKELGVHPSTVVKYLKHKLVPDEVQEMIAEGKIKRNKALDITLAFLDDEKAIIQMAKNVSRMTKAEWHRAIKYKRETPGASVEEVINISKIPRKTHEVILSIDYGYWKALGDAAKERETEVTELLGDILEEWLKGEGYA